MQEGPIVETCKPSGKNLLMKGYVPWASKGRKKNKDWVYLYSLMLQTMTHIF